MFVAHRWCWGARECYWGLWASVAASECCYEWVLLRVKSKMMQDMTMTCRARIGFIFRWHCPEMKLSPPPPPLPLSLPPSHTITQLLASPLRIASALDIASVCRSSINIKNESLFHCLDSTLPTHFVCQSPYAVKFYPLLNLSKSCAWCQSRTLNRCVRLRPCLSNLHTYILAVRLARQCLCRFYPCSLLLLSVL